MKICVFVCVLMLMSQISLAQDFFHIAPTFGYTRAVLYNNTDFNSPSEVIEELGNMKPNIGIELGINKENPTALIIQLLYAKQGQQFKGTRIMNNTYYEWNTKVDLDYIKVPFLVEYKTTTTKDIKGAFSLGMYGAYRINYKDETVFVDTTFNNPNGFTENFENQFYTINYNNAAEIDLKKTTSKNVYNTFNMGFIAGYGINYKLSKHTFLDAKFMADYSVSNPENLSYKDRKPARWAYNKDRVYSHLINYGLQVSIRYQFKESY